MEKHLFKFGDSSLAFIIPKKWAVKHKLSGASRIIVSEGSRGELMISPGEIKNSEAERHIDRSLDPQLLARWIGLHYMYGASKLHLHSEGGFSQAQLDAIEGKLSADCVGFEVTSQSNSEIVVEDFTNIRDMDLEKVVSRIRFLIEQEFREVLDGGDPKTIRKIEQRVNRFYMLGIRYVNIAQPKDYLRYYGLLNMLELISDKVDEATRSFEKRSRQPFEVLREQFSLCFTAFAGDEKAIAKVSELRKEARKKIARAKLPNPVSYLLAEVADSIASIAEYGFTAEKNGTI